TALDLSKFNTKNVSDMRGVFSGCKSLKSLDLSSFNTSAVKKMNQLFENVPLVSLTLGDAFRFVGDDSKLPVPAALNAGDKLTGKWIKKNRGSYPQSPGGFMKYYGKNELTAGTYVAEIEAPLLWGDAPWTFDKNTGTLTIESGRLVKSDTSPWKRDDDKKIDGTKIKKIIFTGPVLAPEDSTELFRRLTSLTEFENLTYLDTSEVTNMDKMFYDCYDLKQLDLSNFNTSNVTSIVDMFFYCVSLKSLDLSKFDTKKMTDMTGLFKTCTGLKTLDLSSFNTLSKPKMTDMFNDTVLSSLTLGNEFRFIKDDSHLSNPAALTPGDLKREGNYLTGNWIKKDNQSAPYDTQKFMTNYGKGDLKAGTYVAETKALLWGDAPYAFDSDTGVLTISQGTLDKTENA
ncbi:BspA family leucine-rich repeat surface protein, partial [Lactococcus piscium]